MKCKHCGFEMPDGAIYCEHCGKPVQMVPDYNMFEDDVLPSIVSGQKGNGGKQQNSAAQETAAGQDEESRVSSAEKGNASAEKPSYGKPEKKASKKVMIFSCIMIAAFAVIVILAFYMNTPGYQKGAGDRAFASGNYSGAVSHYTKALSVHDTDADIAASLGDSYMKLKDNENAEKYYQIALSNDSENAKAFAGLCSLYAETQNYDGLNAMKDAAVTAEQQKAIEGAYISEVTFSEEGGEYDDDVELSLSSPEGFSVYYTTDGKEPEPDTADLFEDGEPIEITEGDTTVKARAVSGSGSLGPVTEKDFSVKYALPDYPKVSPDGGEFSAPTQVVMSYPKDSEAKIYYTWDGSDPTKASSLYTGPVDIPEGNNVLSAIVVDSHDLISSVYRCNFVYLPTGEEPQQ